ncbi:MAG TPA: hypothetical protein VF532_16530 [Candidatus Angelobacter sp.]
MKTHRFLLSVVLLTISTVALAQSQAQKSADAQKPSEAQKSFDAMKALAGSWEGRATLDPPMAQMSDDKAGVHVSLRVTSRGHALVHEMQESGTPLDPARYDHPVTMLYVDGDRLLLTHFCDAGNRPRMTGKVSADGKKIEFDFLDLSGGNQHGHMYHAVFTIIDADHHIEEWTYMMPGDKPMHGRLDLHRSKPQETASR